MEIELARKILELTQNELSNVLVRIMLEDRELFLKLKELVEDI